VTQLDRNQASSEGIGVVVTFAVFGREGCRIASTERQRPGDRRAFV
jgi:hypothetical protein